MPTKSVTVTVASIGASAGPFNISDDVLGVVAMSVSRAQLLAGYSVNVDTNASVITVTSVGTCTTSLNIYLATPTPTPTPTITPTPTVTPTPTQAPIYFDSNFTSTSNLCGRGGRIWSRLIAPSGSTVELTLTSDQYVTSINSVSASMAGTLYLTTLPSANPSPGTVVTSSYDSVLYNDVPTVLTDTEVTTRTIPAAGYIDLMLIHVTNNVASNFSNGQSTVTITKVNGVSVNNAGSLTTGYLCSDRVIPSCTTATSYLITNNGTTSITWVGTSCPAGTIVSGIIPGFGGSSQTGCLADGSLAYGNNGSVTVDSDIC